MSSDGIHNSIEAKYTLDGSDYFVLSALRHLCLHDPDYPCDHINSIYFDTVDLALLDQKVNSEFSKNKVRLRWYGAPHGSGTAVQTYLEIKQKRGVQRYKVRKQFELDARWLLPGKECLMELSSLVHNVHELGWSPNAPLFPMIVIRYFRYRFWEPMSRARIALDTGIMYSSVNSIFFPESVPRTLRHGVLEIKSDTGEIPPALMAIKSRVNTRDSFSKYEECWNLYSSIHYRRERTASRYD